jgi:hypothetical protein
MQPLAVRGDVDASQVWDEPQPQQQGQQQSLNQSSVLNQSVYRPSAREVALQEAVSGWAISQRRTGGGGETLAAHVARVAPDEHGAWALVAEQQQRGAAASSAHLERQMRAVVLAAASGSTLGGSQSLAPAVQHFCASRGIAGGVLSRVWLLLRCGAAQEAAVVARQGGDGRLAEAIERGGGYHPAGQLAASKPDWSAALSAALSSQHNEAAARDSGAYSTTEDYLWLRLRHVVGGDLSSLQQTLRKNSAAFSGRPALQMLLHLLVLDYEAAIVPALQNAALRPDALHLALAVSVPSLFSAVAAAVQQMGMSGQTLADYCLAGGLALSSRLLVAAPAQLLPVLEQAVPEPEARARVLAESGRALARSGRCSEAALLLQAAGLFDEAASQHCQLLARALARGAAAEGTVIARAKELQSKRPASSLGLLLAAGDMVALAAQGNPAACLAAAETGPLARLLPASPGIQSFFVSLKTKSFFVIVYFFCRAATELCGRGESAGGGCGACAWPGDGELRRSARSAARGTSEPQRQGAHAAAREHGWHAPEQTRVRRVRKTHSTQLVNGLRIKVGNYLLVWSVSLGLIVPVWLYFFL